MGEWLGVLNLFAGGLKTFYRCPEWSPLPQSFTLCKGAVSA